MCSLLLVCSCLRPASSTSTNAWCALEIRVFFALRRQHPLGTITTLKIESDDKCKPFLLYFVLFRPPPRHPQLVAAGSSTEIHERPQQAPAVSAMALRDALPHGFVLHLGSINGGAAATTNNLGDPRCPWAVKARMHCAMVPAPCHDKSVGQQLQSLLLVLTFMRV